MYRKDDHDSEREDIGEPRGQQPGERPRRLYILPIAADAEVADAGVLRKARLRAILLFYVKDLAVEVDKEERVGFPRQRQKVGTSEHLPV